MKKKYPLILTDENFGEEASQLFEDANSMLDLIIKENWLQVKSVIGVWKANSDGDDILLKNEKDEIIENFRT